MGPLRQTSGITLIDLVMVVAIIGILAVIAFPIYEDYIHTARVTLLRAQMQSIQLLQEDRRNSHNTYAEGVWDPASGITTLGARLGWDPGTDLVTILVECHDDGDKMGECAPGTGYTITATHRTAPDEPATERIEP